MGIKNLLKFLNSNYPELIKKINTNNFQGKKIAIDISILLYQVIIAIRNSGADLINMKGEITSHILGLFNKTIVLLKMNIIPVYVFDGKPPDFKSKVLQSRREVKQKAYSKLEEEDLSEEDRIKYFKRTVTISRKQINECKELLDLMGIPYVEAPEEADSQCAQLVKAGLVEGVLTEDMDILTFGATTIYKNLTSYKKEQMEINLPEILSTLKLTYEQFVELCILFGCDYNDKLKDTTPETIYTSYLNHKNIPDTLKLLNRSVSATELNNFNSYKKYFINPPVHNITKIEYMHANIIDLDKLLVSKYGLVRSKIISKLKFLENITPLGTFKMIDLEKELGVPCHELYNNL
jgi:flap endonuclease-1